MFYCRKDRMGGMTHALSNCPQCKRATNSVHKLCTGCAVRAGRCAVCLEPVRDVTLGKRFVASVGAIEKKYDRAMAAAQRQFKKTIEPFAEQAASLELARETSHAEYDAMIKSFQQAQEDAETEAERVHSQGGDIIAAQAAAQKAMAELHAAADAGMAKLQSAEESAKAPMGANFELYTQARIAKDQAERRASGIMETRFDRLFGHLRVDQQFAEMMKRFA
jgi:hypothetical protein